MSRTRRINPGFFKNEQLAELPALARIAFIGLWTEADREGKVNDRQKRLKSLILPYDKCDFNKYLQLLHDSGFITRYEIEGIPYIIINNFLRYQKPSPRENPSIIPDPPGYNKGDAQALPKSCSGTTQAIPEQPSYLNSSSYLNSEEELSKNKAPVRNAKHPRASEGNGGSTLSAQKKFSGFNLTDTQIALIANRLGIDHPLAESLIFQLEEEIKADLHKAPNCENVKGVFAWVSKALESRCQEYLQRQQPVTADNDEPPLMGFGG